MNSANPLERLAQRWSKHVELSDEDRDAILALPYTLKSFGKDAYIVREGREATECSLLLSGFAYRQKLLRDGSRQIISFHVPTEFVDLQNGVLGLADHNVQSLENSDLAMIPRTALIETGNAHPMLRIAMWMDTLVDASIFREWVVNVGRRDSRARIAHLLCELALRLRGIGAEREGTLDFPITQEQLADATGLTSVHTNRTLQGLRKDGLIQLNAKSLKVLDWDKLRDAADFDELYLHRDLAATAGLGGSAAGAR